MKLNGFYTAVHIFHPRYKTKNRKEEKKKSGNLSLLKAMIKSGKQENKNAKMKLTTHTDHKEHITPNNLLK